MPETHEYIPKDFVWPREYAGLPDEDLDDLVVRHAPFEDVDVPYPDADFENDDSDSEDDESSSDDDESSDEDDEDDEEEEEEDDTRPSSSSSSSSTGDDTTLSSEETRSEAASSTSSSLSSRKRIDGGTDMSLPVPKKPTGKDLKKIKKHREKEAIRSIKRMRERREEAVAKARRLQALAEAENERRKTEAMDQADRAKAEATSGEHGSMVDELEEKKPMPVDVGFDPMREYSEEEITAMAIAQVRGNAERGLDENGKPKGGLLN